MAPSATDLLVEQARLLESRRQADPEFVAAVHTLIPSLRDVFDLLSIATPTKGIKTRLKLSEATTRRYVSDALSKTGCADRNVLILRAAQTGLSASELFPRPESSLR